MFNLKHINLLGEKALHIQHSKESLSMSIIPATGGHLASLVFEGNEIIDGFQNKQELSDNAWGKSALLYPFPNRMKSGQFTFKSQSFQFPINDADTGNALHGFGMQQEMQVESIKLGEEEAIVKLSYAFNGDLEYYPWPFVFQIEYTLKADHQFMVRFMVRNVGDSEMPFGMGWHPYLLIEQEGAATALELPRMYQVEVDEFMIPTGNKTKFETFANSRAIEDFSFDTGFALNGASRAEVQILNQGKKPLTFWQESGEHQFRFLQVFIPPSRNAIALEPMTCNIDAFNNQEGLWLLQPGEERQLTCGLKI